MSYPRGINPAEAYTSEVFELGERGRTKAGTWVFAQASSAVAQYAACKIDNDFTAVEATNTITGSEPTAIGVAQVALAADEYGWFWVGEGGGSGKGIKVLAAAGVATDAKLYASTVAGVVTDGVLDLIAGLTLVETNSGAEGPIECYSPVVLIANGQD